MTGMKRALVIAACVLAACVGAYFLFFRTSDEREIGKKLDRLAQAVRVEGAENPVMRGTRINSEFAEIFVKEVIVEIPELTDIKSGRHELTVVATQAGSYYQSVRLSFERVQLQFDEAKRTARVGATATMIASRGSGDERDTRELTLRFDKIDGDWKIASIVVSPKSQ
jgi:hypothetical protein